MKHAVLHCSQVFFFALDGLKATVMQQDCTARPLVLVCLMEGGGLAQLPCRVGQMCIDYLVTVATPLSLKLAGAGSRHAQEKKGGRILRQHTLHFPARSLLVHLGSEAST